MTAVPWLVCAGRIMRDQLPACEMSENGALIVCEDGNVNVRVIARLLAEPGVDGPAAAKRPPGPEGGHEAGDAGDGFGYVVRRLAWDGIRQEMLLVVGRRLHARSRRGMARCETTVG